MEKQYLADMQAVCKFYDKVWMPPFAKKLPVEDQQKYKFRLLAVSQADYLGHVFDNERVQKLAVEQDPRAALEAKVFVFNRLRQFVQPPAYFQPLWDAKVELTAEEMQSPYDADHPVMRDGLNLLPRPLLVELNEALQLHMEKSDQLVAETPDEGEDSVRLAAPKS